MRCPVSFVDCRRWRIREVDDREADEDHSRIGLHDGGLQAVPARRLQQHHPVPRGHPQGHAKPRHRLQQHRQRGERASERSLFRSEILVMKRP